MKQYQDLTKYIFNKLGTNIYFFLLYWGLVHHHHRILKLESFELDIHTWSLDLSLWTFLIWGSVKNLIFPYLFNFSPPLSKLPSTPDWVELLYGISKYRLNESINQALIMIYNTKSWHLKLPMYNLKVLSF